MEASRSQEPSDRRAADAAITVRDPRSSYATFAVEARSSVAPRDVERLLGGSFGQKLRAMTPHIPVLVVAPWLSERTQTLLAAEGVNYVDLTGNARVQLDNPALFVQSQGAARDPAPAPRGRVRLRGSKAGRLLRTLVDVRPPYGVGELAAATGLAPGYVSRVLEALDEDALVERARRGRVERTDVEGLLRRWAEAYDVFATNEVARFLAPRGARAALERLERIDRPPGRFAVTGSFAAVRLAPVAAPALLAVYADDVEALSRELELMPADAGANVALLRPFDPVAWEGSSLVDGVAYVTPSQAAIDCLSGNGRMPAEGEALLGWMLADERRWRRSSLTADPPAA
ncbi:MAG: hypothetical protein JSS99_03650 [Actinobacteria bacterium]|nr:hypothetical protein [Actinomycetota bacterium]